MINRISLLIMISLTCFSSAFAANEKFKTEEAGSATSKSSSSETTIKPAYPTHYAFMSTAKVNDIGEFVISPREISGGLGADFMLFASPWNGRIGSAGGAKWGNAISDTRIGLKYQLSSNILLGGGLNIEGGQSGLALFVVTPIVENSETEIVFSPSGVFKLNDDDNNGWHSIGFGFGGKKQITELFDVIAEGKISTQFEPDGEFDEDGNGSTLVYVPVGITGALRIVPPPVPFLYFDLGIDMVKYVYKGNEDRGDEFLGAYLDLGIGFSL